MAYQVIILPAAQRDIDGILAWIAERSPQGADAWERRLFEIVEFLELHAHGCAQAPESSRQSHVVQQCLFRTRRGRPYRVLFTMRGSDVYILHVLASGQDDIPPEHIEFPQ